MDPPYRRCTQYYATIRI